MKQRQFNTSVAGVDVGKRRLDAAVHGSDARIAVGNTPDGIAQLVTWLCAHDVGRVGLEASGGYERAVCEVLRDEGFEVVLHQPIEVRLFARLKRRRAKTDRLDAILIAAATVQVDTVKAAQDRRLTALAERLTAYEQISGQAAQIKTFLEHVTLADVAAALKTQLAALKELKRQLLADLLAEIAAHPDLARRLALLSSLPGVGPVVAATLLVRMPELGAMTKGQAASLAGVAPYDRKSGNWTGEASIGGGRERPRRMLYMAAIAARLCDPTLKAFAQRLSAAGKKPKVVIVAVMRKLIEAANLVLQRGTPWTQEYAR